ncbi:MAG: hypothetical protein JHD02_02060, partial [Thermoleophilaceae bacterium]|nr:hypothetical protein [Thermoleophilaceae bacterium]
VGLKENVIIGKLIPAATGLKRYRTIEIEPTEPLPAPGDLDFGRLSAEELAALGDGDGGLGALTGEGLEAELARLSEQGVGE